VVYAESCPSTIGPITLEVKQTGERSAGPCHVASPRGLRGRVTKHHRSLLRLHLNQIDALDAAMATLDAQVERNLGPFRTAVDLVMSVPGIKNLGAHVIVS
jgi:transposase